MGEVCANPVIHLREEIASGHCTLVPAEPDLIVCESVGLYIPRNPEKTVPYNVVAGYLVTFLDRQQERDRVVPRFVQQELRAFLDCGVLARGFLRVHCDDCGLDRVVPYSKVLRNFCACSKSQALGNSGGRSLMSAAASGLSIRS